ncbi:MAG: hypothetical protein LC803_21725 [Acidobacteria bacterium]|nr:hypothetical protein [Acidobacteriota bacterium]
MSLTLQEPLTGTKEQVNSKTESNNGMHPTPFKRASHASCVGARLMPGVRRFAVKPEGHFKIGGI